ncbi:glycosyltransferase [Vibrio mangrovi]|uniref:Glycosyltransferase family 2 protein n=1 Tax=Vibrio mangrovi TaxID=474394 RepID=A0A1Y6IZT7_9VIBR|nr:glycosyltransferase family 2 protein [Vibrio mangrovi]MDW6002198.1 glycosyltransferase family 2 protein [Vibrio mangrovi]SMS01543.1 putative glycosyltransferase EpsJ [Vibrio mangrovi]
MSLIKYSIVIPIYNTYKFLDRLIESIPRRNDLELIFVDDSENKNINYINDRADASGLNFKVLYNNKNMGVTYSRNKGYLNSKGDYIIFLDSDDVLLDDAIDKIDKQLEKEICDVYLFRVCDENNLLVGKRLTSEIKYNNSVEFLSSYGIGECLVVVKKHNGILPFLGILKGHELCGLFIFLRQLDHGSALLSGDIVRMYYQDNHYSLSKKNNFKKRFRAIALGHYIIFSRLMKSKHILLSVPWLIKAIVRFVQSR